MHIYFFKFCTIHASQSLRGKILRYKIHHIHRGMSGYMISLTSTLLVNNACGIYSKWWLVKTHGTDNTHTRPTGLPFWESNFMHRLWWSYIAPPPKKKNAHCTVTSGMRLDGCEHSWEKWLAGLGSPYSWPGTSQSLHFRRFTDSVHRQNYKTTGSDTMWTIYFSLW